MSETLDTNGWIGVDLDGTLAHYDEWVSWDHIGEPVPLMVDRVIEWLADGRDVRIMTARVCRMTDNIEAVRMVIEGWCDRHLGRVLPITHEKDYAMVELWDDRAVQVVKNEGLRADRHGHDEVTGVTVADER